MRTQRRILKFNNRKCQEMPDDNQRGRPSVYTPELADEICRRLAEGESLRQICLDEKIPARSTVKLWIINNLNGFSAQYANAKDLGIDEMADELLDIADDGTNDWMEKRNSEGENIGWSLNGEAVARSRIRVDTRKWYLSKIAPKTYGDKLTHEGNPDKPINLSLTVTYVEPDNNTERVQVPSGT
jgi:hypothetical protein